MSKSNLPKKLTDDQMKYWLANTNLTQQEMAEWYDSFVEQAQKTDKIDKDNFNKLIHKLNVKNKHTDSLNDYMFNGLRSNY
jgi:Ca2+-binding EF-hand superfamily protein